MKSVKTRYRFSLQELLEFFRPHSIQLPKAESTNVVPLRLGNIVKKLSEPKIQCGRERTVRYINDGPYAEVETLSAIHRGEDIIVGAVLNSEHCVAAPPFLVRKDGLNSSAGRFYYEVWAVVEGAPTDPSLLLELCASLEALGESIGVVPKLLRIAEINGKIYDFDTRALLLMYAKIKELFVQSRGNRTERIFQLRPVADLVAFRSNKAQCGQF